MIKEALKKHPSIEKLEFSIKKINSLKMQNNIFTIKEILERHSDVYWKGFLNYLEKLINISKNIFNKKQIRDRIMNSPFTAKWEFELIDYFGKRCIEIIDIEVPTEGDNNVDFKIELCKKEVLVEANIQFLKDKEFNEGKARFAPIDSSIPLRVANKVKKNKINKAKIPVILAFNGTYSGIDYINLFSCVDKEIKKCISGILLKTNGGIFFQKNKDATYPLTDKQIKELMRTI